jgi:LPS sulfotransferase NodH
MKKQRNYIIYGPGRTGSHWVELMLIKLFTPPPVFRNMNCTFFPNGWMYHTNQIQELLEMPDKIRDCTTLIVCERKDYFATAISHVAALQTDEWHHYTDKPVAPFHVDPTNFKHILQWLGESHQTVRSDLMPAYNRMIFIDFDSLNSAAVPEKYVADQLGIEYTPNPEYNAIYKNTRNYKESILNYDQLVDVHRTICG